MVQSVVAEQQCMIITK